jgi:hypothetical protein
MARHLTKETMMNSLSVRSILAAGLLAATFSFLGAGGASPQTVTHRPIIKVCEGDLWSGKTWQGVTLKVMTCPSDIAARKRSIRLWEQQKAYADAHRVTLCEGDYWSGKHPYAKFYKVVTCPSDIAARKRSIRLWEQQKAYADAHRITVCVGDYPHGYPVEKGKSYNFLFNCQK